MIISIHYYNGISRFYFLMHTNLSWSIPDLCQDLRALSIPLNDLPGLLSWSNRIAFQRKNRLSTPASRRSTWLVTQKCSQTRRLILTLFTGPHRLRERIIAS